MGVQKPFLILPDRAIRALQGVQADCLMGEPQCSFVPLWVLVTEIGRVKKDRPDFSFQMSPVVTLSSFLLRLPLLDKEHRASLGRRLNRPVIEPALSASLYPNMAESQCPLPSLPHDCQQFFGF